jgi:hypothetical protein
MVKEAAYRDAFTKLAAEEGIDLTKLSDIDLANEYSAFCGQLKIAEIQQAKFAEFERVGRALARHWFYKAAAEAAALPLSLEQQIAELQGLDLPPDVLEQGVQNLSAQKAQIAAGRAEALRAARQAEMTAKATGEGAAWERAFGAASAKKPGLWSHLSPAGLGEALSKGNWGTALRKAAPLGAAVLGGKYLLDRRREREMAGQQASMGAPPAVSMAGV